MTNFDVGRKAENIATEYLQEHSYKIMAQNWRLRSCEIDIVALKENIAYCVEVKYRRSDSQGDGLEYVTSAKLKQMQFAAEQWVHAAHWPGGYQLAVVEVSGDNFQVTNFLDDIIL